MCHLLFIQNSSVTGCPVVLFAKSGHPNSNTFLKLMNKNFGGQKAKG